MTLKDEVNSQLVQLLAQRAELDENIARGRAMLEALKAAEARDEKDEASNTDNNP